jgi:NitT/TauT family transport system permease protein
MTTFNEVSEIVEREPLVSRKAIAVAGRIGLAVLLVAAWQWGAASLGSVFFAYPADVVRRLGEITMNGELFADIYATLRVSALGFLIGTAAGVLLPFLLHRSQRWTEAIEPYVLGSQGIPKYALAPWLILWFGIGDAPKLVVVTTVVFYVPFVNVMAGIRSVDQRLVRMARILGASEAKISREVYWNSLLPFFFSSLKIALPRAVGACIVGEFLVSTTGVGHYIEHARELSDTVGVYAGIVVATALVLAINGLVEYLERRALAWRPIDRDMVV